MTTWGDTDGVHLIDRETGDAVCDPRAGGPGTNKRGETGCSMCLAALAERAAGDPTGHTVVLRIRYHEAEPMPEPGQRLPFIRDDGRALLPEIVAIEPPDGDGLMAATLYCRDKFFTDPATIDAGH
jgi:hypothetical protein